MDTTEHEIIKIVLSTRNKNKVREIQHFFEALPVEWLSIDDFPDAHDVIEDKDTLEENAIKKAKEIAVVTGHIALADDTGLEVDALNGAPGVYSARYAGENATYRDNNLKLLRALNDIPREQRTARFVCVLALAYPNGDTQIVRGVCTGIITEELRGKEGFGYDPIFYVPHRNKTFAEMSLDEKNTVSHRSDALKKMYVVLQNSVISGQ